MNKHFFSHEINDAVINDGESEEIEEKESEDMDSRTENNSDRPLTEMVFT